jgi:predicted DNA-binding protein (UPF0251 family)
MPRPCCCRRISGLPNCAVFKPAGVPAASLEKVALGLDELEAIRLADLEGLYQEQAAERMGVSRQTLGRILESGRKKVAQALIEGKLLLIEGGQVEMTQMRTFQCSDCQHVWSLPHGTGRPQECPSCKSCQIHRRAGEGGGPAGCGRHRHGPRQGSRG